jgi:hypothetical protein
MGPLDSRNGHVAEEPLTLSFQRLLTGAWNLAFDLCFLQRHRTLTPNASPLLLRVHIDQQLPARAVYRSDQPSRVPEIPTSGFRPRNFRRALPRLPSCLLRRLPVDTIRDCTGKADQGMESKGQGGADPISQSCLERPERRVGQAASADEDSQEGQLNARSHAPVKRRWDDKVEGSVFHQTFLNRNVEAKRRVPRARKKALG